MLDKELPVGNHHPELDMFSLPPVQDEITKSKTIDYYPKSSFSTTPAIFDVDTTVGDFMSLQDMRLYGRFKVYAVDASGAELATSSLVNDYLSLSNYSPSTLFRSCECYLNNVKVSGSTDLYHHKSYLEVLLSYDKLTKDNIRTNSLYFPGDPGKENHQNKAGGDNLEKSTKKFEKDMLLNLKDGIEFITLIHVDLFHCVRYLPDKMNLKLKFFRNSDEMTLTQIVHKSGVDIGKYKIEIVDLRLRVHKLQVSDEFYKYFNKKLETQKVVLPFTRGVITTQLMTKGSASFRQQNLIVGPIPRQIFIVFVKGDVFNGTINSSPFIYSNVDLESAYVQHGQEMIPNQMFNCNTNENIFQFAEIYEALHDTLSLGYYNGSFDIDKLKFLRDSFILAFNLDPDKCNGARKHSVVTGKIDLFLKFRSPLADNYNLLCYSTHDNCVFIDKDRIVTMDY